MTDTPAPPALDPETAITREEIDALDDILGVEGDRGPDFTGWLASLPLARRAVRKIAAQQAEIARLRAAVRSLCDSELVKLLRDQRDDIEWAGATLSSEELDEIVTGLDTIANTR